MKQGHELRAIRELGAQELEQVAGGELYTYLGKAPDWADPFAPVADLSTGGAYTDPTGPTLVWAIGK
jgi:hypothetical protein